MDVIESNFSVSIGGRNVHVRDGMLDVMRDMPTEVFSPKAMSISVEFDVQPLREDSFSTLFSEEPRFDVVVKDERGRELHMPNARVVERWHVVGRIPRKMKKILKKRHGVYWTQHHPNVERFYSISNKDY